MRIIHIYTILLTDYICMVMYSVQRICGTHIAKSSMSPNILPDYIKILVCSYIRTYKNPLYHMFIMKFPLNIVYAKYNTFAWTIDLKQNGYTMPPPTPLWIKRGHKDNTCTQIIRKLACEWSSQYSHLYRALSPPTLLVPGTIKRIHFNFFIQCTNMFLNPLYKYQPVWILIFFLVIYLFIYFFLQNIYV